MIFKFCKKNRKCFSLIALAALVCSFLAVEPMKAYAATWVAPEEDTVAEAAIVIDADSGTVLWGKNIHEQYYPASITKLLTAYVVLNKCSLSESVTVAEEAVRNLESGAVSVGFSAGDETTVEELLYAMLLRSCNVSANALAVHVSGSIEEFGKLMTKTAADLGCQNSLFQNPSGLTNPENLTSAYDMAVIGAAISKLPEFLEIESHVKYKIESPTAKYPDGFTVNAEHKMILSGTGYTDSRVIGGKTGYIKASGNTLVTIAEEDGKRLVAVVLKDKNPDHYKDTKMLLDFGFANFENYMIEDPAKTYDAENRLVADKIIEGRDNHIISHSDAVITLPKGADPEAVKASFDYNLTELAPDQAVGKIVFRYDDVKVGSAYILNDRESTLEIESIEQTKEGLEFGGKLPTNAIMAVALVLVIAMAIGTIILIIRHKKDREVERREILLERRRQRLEELNVSEEEFGAMVDSRRERSKRRAASRNSRKRDIIDQDD